MKLIEGMKNLKVLEKKIAHNTEYIMEYAALPSTRKPHFGTSEEQRKQVQSLIQSNIDMGKEYLALKSKVDMTNLKTNVQIGKETYTIADLLLIKRKIGKSMEYTYQALTDTKAEQQIAQNRSKDVPVQVERYYNETDKHAGIQFWQNLQDEIEVRLETINATTELVEL
jgi:hypothetical protein